MDEHEDTGVLPRGEARGRRTEEHRAVDSVREYGLSEADHRESSRAGRGHTVVHVTSISSVLRLQTASDGFQRDTVTATRRERHSTIDDARRTAASAMNRVLIIPSSTDGGRTKVFWVHSK